MSILATLLLSLKKKKTGLMGEQWPLISERLFYVCGCPDSSTPVAGSSTWEQVLNY